MNLRTELHPERLGKTILPTDTIFMIGSCFSDNIGDLLKQSKFNVTHNPLGILFNPISISSFIHNYLLENDKVKTTDLWEQDGVYSHKDFHSTNNKINQDAYIETVNNKINESSVKLSKADFIIITLGSAWVYKEKKTGKYVGNCHKKPNHLFTKELLDIEDILSAYRNLFLRLTPNVQVIFTVSPVRHLKDGIVENSRSKAILIESCHRLKDSFPQCSYFPAYELMIDDLRDYRFYKEDMLHPTDQAVQYIWKKFQDACLHITSVQKIKEIAKINTAMNHMPLQEDSNAYRDFCKKQLEHIHHLQSMYLELAFTKETAFFLSKIKN